MLAYLQYTHTFKLVKVNNPSLNHAQYPTFSFEAATLYESTKMKKENMVPYVQKAWRGKKITHIIFPLRQGNIIVHQN